MKELEQFVENILSEKDGYKLGEPWKFRKNSMGAIIPILRSGEHVRDYVTLSESKEKVKFSDTGMISPINCKNGCNVPLFIRSGTLLEGISGQDRAVINSIIVPVETVKINVRCVHASRPTSYGGGFKYSGYVPRVVHKNLGFGQSETWNSVHSYYAMDSSGLNIARNNNRTNSAIFGASMEQEVKHDDLPNIKKKQVELDKNLQGILSEVPCLENQVGAIIVGMKGIVGIESFDHPDSWKAQYKDAIANYSDELAEKAQRALFKFDKAEIMKVVNKFLKSISLAQVKPIDTNTFIIEMKGFTGEVVVHNEHIVHMFLMTNEDDDVNATYKQTPVGIRLSDDEDEEEEDDERQEHNRPITFGRNHFYIFASVGMKKGFSDVAEAIDRKGGQATFSEIHNEVKDKKLSTATVSTRLKEGKEIGLFGEGIRKTNGKKVYTIFKE